ncbi:hypothetical protein EC991_002889 [Linnemannia zychae]|nr:hypothetical protein EC991_002889 [Linnemannia zychae]
MSQIQILQQFRATGKAEVIRIPSARDENGKQVIFLSDIESQFRGALSIRQGGIAVPFLKNAANTIIYPERIEPHPNAVLDVFFGKNNESLSAVEKAFTCDAATFYSLGVDYDKNGVGLNNSTMALQNYVKAAELGHAEARTKVGIMYRDGSGVGQNYAKAYEWLFLNAKEGVAGSQTELGDMFNTGQGVEQNYEKAREWFRKAAEQGHDRGQYMLGRYYYYGYGGEKSLALAKEWVEKSKAQGYKPAREFESTLYPPPTYANDECCTIL